MRRTPARRVTSTHHSVRSCRSQTRTSAMLMLYRPVRLAALFGVPVSVAMSLRPCDWFAHLAEILAFEAIAIDGTPATRLHATAGCRTTTTTTGWVSPSPAGSTLACRERPVDRPANDCAGAVGLHTFRDRT